MTQLNKENNKDLALAIQELYINTYKVNTIAGNAAFDQARIPTQIELIKAELKETNVALVEENLGELVDGVGDLLVTISSLLLILDQNLDLLENAPLYLNAGDNSVEELIAEINIHIEAGNWIDSLGSTEDLAAQLNADIISSLSSIGESNLSKFPTVKMINDSDTTIEEEVAAIEAQGRYESVCVESSLYEGEEYVVFKTKFDKKNNESYPLGKFIKPPTFFKEPEIIVYE